MAKLSLPDLDVLCQRFRYDPETGNLLCAIYKVPLNARRRNLERAQRWNSEVYGKPVGSRDGSEGYLVVGVNGTNYYVHRIAWKMAHGCDPIGDIDHINGNKIDNRLKNLRDVDRSTNSKNKVTRVISSSGVRGVYKISECRFIANVKELGRIHHLGTFSSLEEAKAARLAYDVAHGFTDRHLTSPAPIPEPIQA